MLNQREAKGKDDEGPSCLPGLLLLLSFMIFFNTKKCFGFIYLFFKKYLSFVVVVTCSCHLMGEREKRGKAFL
jgi:hypothetical protein